ncbi:ubiquinol-cytochrome c reductase iron-sulfur subunit [Corynebacterium aquatimens]|uniref:Cytochrome bc1 complex Rieske iron-sulfur subunit n=1 Tax=Corynebacterium aquatimens TaxID=1190508 RepID=A0A931E0E4_9CORY|nr:ubiquinol-cytochrome c reductase iron-sulfur subunit [Corynebacterium aquatimens]MBG6121988.1 ubiquinol-cytochrome c reductase iron-sulfur subunit [Corynebacterium aquatimens]WJY65473.1 Arsenite oxidase subunit AioB precursor [Corynebacterium aquatimens]
MSNEVKKTYTDAELDKMSNAELAALGTELDDVTVAYRKERFPLENDPQEKRAAAGINTWLAISLLAGIAFLGIYIFWPWQPKFHGDEGLWIFSLYTPLLGLTSGLAFIALGVAIVQYVKKFIPEEISVQRRHDGRSSELDRRTTTALLNDAWETSTFGRRKAMQGLLGGAGLFAGLMLIAPMGGLIKNPWKPRHAMDYHGDGTLWTQGWSMLRDNPGLKIYLGRDTGAVAEAHTNERGAKHYTTQGVSRLVRMRPEDLAAASMETIFPLLEEDVNDGDKYDPTRDVYEEHMHSLHGPRNPVMLIRLRSQDAARATERQGQEDFHYGDFYAYSKICTHIGCPTSLYEAQTNRILCPCHQSQFDALAYGRPVFGPAARALPQLPITVDEEGYLIAKGDFIEPVGPAFWERKS